MSTTMVWKAFRNIYIVSCSYVIGELDGWAWKSFSSVRVSDPVTVLLWKATLTTSLLCSTYSLAQAAKYFGSLYCVLLSLATEKRKANSSIEQNRSIYSPSPAAVKGAINSSYREGFKHKGQEPPVWKICAQGKPEGKDSCKLSLWSLDFWATLCQPNFWSEPEIVSYLAAKLF